MTSPLAPVTGSVPGSCSSALPGSLLGLTAAGSLALGGLEVLGARVYDAGVRGFLSVDPVAAPVGAGWAANGYGFVGFSPVGLVDPWGLSPMSAADFYAYRQNRGSGGGSHVLSALGQALQGFGSFAAAGHGGGLGWFGSGGLFGPGAGLDLGALARAGAGFVGSALVWGRGVVDGARAWLGDARAWLGDAWSNVQGFASKAWDWTKDNWQYLLAGAVTVAALISLATPAAPLGGAVLLNMGAGALASTGMQAAGNNWDFSKVDYKQVALDSAISGISAPIGAGAGAFAASRGLGLVGRTAVTEMASGGAQGALTYALDPSIGSKSLSGLAGYTASGAVSGGVQGGAASKTNLFLNRHLGGYVTSGQVAWHLPVTAAASGAVGGGLGGGLNYVGQEVSKGKSLDSITMEDIQKEAIKGGLQSGISSFDVKNLQPVGEVPVMNGVNLGSHMPGSVVAPSSYNTHIVVNGDSYLSPATGQTVYSMPGSLNGASGEFRVVVEQVDGVDVVRRQFFVPQG